MRPKIHWPALPGYVYVIGTDLGTAIPTGGTQRANTPVEMVEFWGGYTGGYAGGGYTPRRPHGTQLKKYSTSSLAS